MKPVQTRDEIIALLDRFSVSTEMLGVGEAKTLDHLVKDVESGEVMLMVQDDKIVLTAVPCGVAIWCVVDGKSYFLTEASIRATAERAIVEELGIKLDRYDLAPQAMEMMHVGPTPSKSYPGLWSEYFIHGFRWEMPLACFRREGYIEHQPDRDTYFVWVPQ